MQHSFAQWRAHGSRFTHRGHSIFVQSGGSAAAHGTLLCIHGLPTASWDWSRLWPALCAHFGMVLAPDMIGFGWSDKPRAHAYSIFDQADLHEALLRERGVCSYRILCHDYGVTVAQELLARHEERRARGDDSLCIEAVVFLNGGLFPETHRPLLIQKLMLTPLGPLLSRALSRRMFASNFRKVFGAHTQPSEREFDEFFALVRAGGGRHMFYRLFHYIPERRAHRERWVSVLRTTEVPLLFVNGADDPVSGGAHAVTRYRELVPHPNTVLLAGIGHYPQVESPEAVWRASASTLTPPVPS